jgi:type II secretory pathway pseudopilin PulG
MKTKGFSAFTLAELLTAIAIIAILLGILMPALNQVRRIARETKQKAQIVSIDIGVTLYKNDFGAYPPSHGCKPTASDPCYYNYCGAQTLAEAMFGQDLLGFYPASKYDPCDPCCSDPNTLRKDPYLDRTNISAFTPIQIFNRDTSPDLEPDRFVICDGFTAVNRIIGKKTYKIGTPVLYFRADISPANKELIVPAAPSGEDHSLNIYNYVDNYYLMGLKRITDGKEHPLWLPNDGKGKTFYGYIRDPMVPNIARPVRPDSFILISAGEDGLYGTKDDICNFEPNLPG